MTTIAHAHRAAAIALSLRPGRSHGCLAAVALTIKGLWLAYWNHQARQATAMLLDSLDDRTLADIGFKRSEILSTVFGSPDRARPYLPDWFRRGRGRV